MIWVATSQSLRQDSWVGAAGSERREYGRGSARSQPGTVMRDVGLADFARWSCGAMSGFRRSHGIPIWMYVGIGGSERETGR